MAQLELRLRVLLHESASCDSVASCGIAFPNNSGLAWPFALVTQPLGNDTQPLTERMAVVVNITNAAIAALVQELHLLPTNFVGPTWLQGEGA